MARPFCSALFAVLLTAACSASTLAPRTATAPDGTPVAQGTLTEDGQPSGSEVTDLQSHHVGDYYVQRFSGTALERPYTLTEKVTAREGGLLVVDYVLTEEGGRSEKLRVRRRATDWQVVRVSKVDGALEREIPAAAYGAMLEKTSFGADSNEAKLSRKAETCVVGERAYACETERYHVVVDGKPATLSLTTSDTFPGRDVRGAIRSSKGNTIYRAELIEAKQGSSRDTASARAAK